MPRNDIDPSGLAVAPLSYLAPTIRRSMGGPDFEVECQAQEVKYRLTDGTEVPARLVLKDDDLDLAFLTPLKPLDKATEAKIGFVPLSEPATQPEVLDSTILISRTGEDLNYIPMLNLGRIFVARVNAACLLPQQQRQSRRARLQPTGQNDGHDLPMRQSRSERRERGERLRPG